MTGRRSRPPPHAPGRLLLRPGILVVPGILVAVGLMAAMAMAQSLPVPPPPKPPVPGSDPAAAAVVPDVPPDLEPAVPDNPAPGDPAPDEDDAAASVNGAAVPLPAAPLPKPPLPVTAAATPEEAAGNAAGETEPDAGTAAVESAAVKPLATGDAGEPPAAPAGAGLPAIPLPKPRPPGMRADDAGAGGNRLSIEDLTAASPTRDPVLARRAAVADRQAAAAAQTLAALAEAGAAAGAPADVEESVTVPAGARPPLPRPPRIRPEPAGQVPELSRLSSGNMLFDRADRNGDLRLSWGEMADARRRRFAEFDRDRNGTIAFQEYSNQPVPIGLRQVPDRLLVLRARRFARYDRDGDGLVSEAEYVDAGQDLFDLMDRNHNGLLTPQEYDLVWRPAAGRVR